MVLEDAKKKKFDVNGILYIVFLVIYILSTLTWWIQKEVITWVELFKDSFLIITLVLLIFNIYTHIPL